MKRLLYLLSLVVVASAIIVGLFVAGVRAVERERAHHVQFLREQQEAGVECARLSEANPGVEHPPFMDAFHCVAFYEAAIGVRSERTSGFCDAGGCR